MFALEVRKASMCRILPDLVAGPRGLSVDRPGGAGS
jgi:hypothetical protein